MLLALKQLCDVETGQSSAVYVLKQWKQFLQFFIIFFSSLILKLL